MSFQRITIIGSMRSSLNRLARVRAVLDLFDRDDPRRRSAQPLQLGEQVRELLGRLDEQAAELERLPRHVLDAVHAEQLGGALRGVGDIVDRERERDQVVAVVRCDEHGVCHRQQLRDDAVSNVLAILHVFLRRAVRPLTEPRVDGAAHLEYRFTRVREQDEDLAGPRADADPHPKIAFTGNHTIAAIAAAAGIVNTHAATMLPATPQRTAERRFVAPEPMTAPETTCVVESG